MPRRPDRPCAQCGDLMWRGRGSLPEGEARCQPCRRRTPIRSILRTCTQCGLADSNYRICDGCYIAKTRGAKVGVGGDARQTRAWRRLRDIVVAEDPICWLQLNGICTHWSETADHLMSVRQRPDLTLERSNLRGACHPCNRARGHMPIENIRPGTPRAQIATNFFQNAGGS